MIDAEIFKKQIMESKILGYATDELLEMIEEMVKQESASKKISWGQSDAVNDSMMDYALEAFESAVIEKIINSTTHSSDAKVVLATTKQNCGCLFNQFKNQLKADMMT